MHTATEKLAPSGKTTNLFFLDNSPDESAPSEAFTSAVVPLVPNSVIHVPFAANACDKHWPIDAKTITNHRIHLSWFCILACINYSSRLTKVGPAHKTISAIDI
uniref:(northern house mosquito) hypothetical protein n=1 Tax=Culex pipiens TaxID=7175 RepID=A0A8D8A3W2_CULPI